MTQLPGVMIRILSADDCAALGFRSPLAIELDYDGVGFVAKVLFPHGIGAFGSGSTVPEAAADLVEVMRAEASSLRIRRENLSPALAQELSLLDMTLVAEGAEPRTQAEAYVNVSRVVGATGPAFNNPAPPRNSYIPPFAAHECTP